MAGSANMSEKKWERMPQVFAFMLAFFLYVRQMCVIRAMLDFRA